MISLCLCCYAYDCDDEDEFEDFEDVEFGLCNDCMLDSGIFFTLRNDVDELLCFFEVADEEEN